MVNTVLCTWVSGPEIMYVWIIEIRNGCWASPSHRVGINCFYNNDPGERVIFEKATRIGNLFILMHN